MSPEGNSTNKEFKFLCGGVFLIEDLARWQVEEFAIEELANERDGNFGGQVFKG